MKSNNKNFSGAFVPKKLCKVKERRKKNERRNILFNQVESNGIIPVGDYPLEHLGFKITGFNCLN